MDKYYWYEFRLRGLSIGAQPKGFVDSNPNHGRFGSVAYDRPLSDEEIEEYELKPIPIRKFAIGKSENNVTTWLMKDGSWTENVGEAKRFTYGESLGELDDLVEQTDYAVFAQVAP